MVAVILRCGRCGDEFPRTTNNRKYCSACGKYGRKSCQQCGKEFQVKGGTTGKFCSRDCCWKFLAHGDMAKRPCLVCGKEFKPRLSKQITCCRKCGQEHQKRKPVVRKCKQCGNEFDPGRHKGQRYCSYDCTHIARRSPRNTKCENCGKPISFSRYRFTRFCSSECRQIPIGSERKTDEGYVLIKVGKDYPGASAKGWMLKHRYVMEQHLGRPLRSWERVHHKFGNRADNRIEKLELWIVRGKSKKDPAGQRLMDLIDLAASRLGGKKAAAILREVFQV